MYSRADRSSIYRFVYTTFVAIDAPSKGSCGSSGIKYPPKTGSTATTTTTSVSISMMLDMFCGC